MKKLLTVLVVFLSFIQFASAQIADTVAVTSKQSTYDLYMDRHKTNLITGFVFLGAGVTTLTIGSASALNSLSDIGSSSYDSTKGETLVIVGLAASLISIPFFIGSRVNWDRARFALKNESVAIGGMNKFNYMAISFKIDL